MVKKAENEMLNAGIEASNDEKVFKRFKSYVMGAYKLQEKKQAKNGGNE